MAAGGELVIDDKFLQSLKRMDDVLQGITDSASDADKSMQKWLSKLNDNSVLNFVEHLSKIASQYRLINETLKDVDGFKDFARKADEANTAIQSLINNIRKTERFNLEIDVEEGLKELKAISDHIDEMIQQEKELAKEEADTHKQRQQEYDELGRSLKEYGDAMVHNFNLLTQQYEAEVKLARKEQEATERKMEAIRKFIEARREAEQTSMHTSSQRDWEEQQRQQQKANEQYAKQVDARRKEREKGIEDAIAFDKREEEAEAKEKEKLEKSLDNYRRYYTELIRLGEEYAQLFDTEKQAKSVGVSTDAIEERKNALVNQLLDLRAKMDEIASSSPEAKERSASIENEIDASRRLVQTKKEIVDATRRQTEEEEAQRKRFREAANGAMDFANALMEISKAQTKLKLQGKTSYDEAMSGYSLLFGGGGAKSLSNLREVQRALEEAKSKQDRFTESGKKRYNELNDALDKVKETIDEVSDASDETNKSHSKLMDTSGQLMRQLALVFSVSQIEGYVNKLVSVRKEFELQQRSLQALLQNKQAANEIWNQTVQLALKSPFRVKDFVTYTKELAAYRIETDKLHDTTKMLADVSAGLGVDMSRLILAFGQVRAAEFLRGTELRQFTEAGIPMLEELADHFSALEGRAVSTADVFERTSKRMVVFADVEAVFNKLTSEGGAFYKMQEKQSDTLYGSISNLHDAIDIMLNDIGKSHDGLLKGSVSIARKMVSNWQTIAVAIKAAAGALVLYKLNTLLTDKALVRMAVSMNVVTASGAKQLTVTQLLNVGFLRLGKSIGAAGKAMKAFLLSNPWTAIIMAIAAAVIELYSTWSDHKKQLDEINKEYDELIRKVSNIRVKFTFSNDLAKRRQELQSLIDVAEQLNISPNIKMDDVTADNIDEIFDNLRKIVIERQGLITALSTEFEKSTHWTISDDLNEDLKEVGGNITKLVPIIEKYKSSVITYIDDLGQLSEERKKMFEPIRKEENELQYYDRLFKAFGEVSKAQKDASVSTEHWFDIMDKAPSVIKDVNNEITKWRTETSHFFDRSEAKKEFDAFVSTILPMLKDIPEEDRSIVIKTWIDTEASKREWDTFTTQYLYGWFEQIPALNIKFKAELPSEKEIEPWKARAIEAITKLNEKIKKEQKGWTKDMVLFSLPTDTDTEESFWNKFKEDITKAETPIIEGQKKLSQALVDNINVMKPYADEAKVIANITDKTTKEERDANTILNKRISLIKEIHSAYEKERKLWDEEKAEERVLQSYMLAYEDAFGKSISGYNFKIKEGVSSELLELIPLAEKAGREAMIALERAIASVEVEDGDFAKKLTDEKLIRQIEDMFGTYELSLELKDMNIPTDIAEKLFGFESLDLEGLKEKLKEFEPQFIGTDQEKKYRDYLQKVEEMEAKALEERMKKYAKFLEQEQTERVKIKLNEVRQLMEIEDTFRIHEKDAREKYGLSDEQWKAYEKQRKAGQEINLEFLKGLDIEEGKAQAILEQNRLLSEQSQIARKGVKRVTQEDLDKNAWEEFKKSSYYETLFADMEHSGTKSLRNLRDKIVSMKTSLKTLPPEIYKQVVEAIEKIENELDNRNPLGALFDAWKDLRELSKKGVTIKTTDGEDINVRSRDKITERLRLENESLEKNREEIALRKQFLHANERIRRQLLEENSTLRDGLDSHRNIDDAISEEIKKLEKEGEIYEANIEKLSTQEGRYRINEARARNAQKGIQEWTNATNDLIGSVDSLLDAFGLAEDSQARIWMKASMGIVDTIASVAQLIIEFTLMEVAANSALGIIGYIAMALKAIATLVATLFGDPDKDLQRQIEALEVSVEALDRKFQKLEKSIKNAMGVGDINRFTDDAIQNLEDQNKALGEMMALEEAKKGTDADKIRDWANEIEDNLEEMERLRNERIKELGGIGDAEEIKSAAEEFTDAWLQAFLETGDGLVGLEDKFNDFARNLIKSQLMHKVVESLITPLTTKINEIVDPLNEGGGEVTDKEWQELMLLWNEQKVVINERLSSLIEELGGLDSLSSNRDLEGLQKGVQGIQESTAQEIVSYMNSLRALVAQRETFYKNNEQLSSLLDNIVTDGINPMLDQLRVIANNTESIHTLLDSVVRAGHSQGGYGIKVFSD